MTRTHAALYGFSLFLLKNPQDAEDAVQETYVKAYQSAAQYRSQGKPMAWLDDHSAERGASAPARAPPHRGHDAGGLAGAVLRQAGTSPKEDLLTLRALLETLSEEERQISLPPRLGGLKHREIAAMLDLALPTVLSKYHRAMKKLGKAAEEAE